MSENHDPVVAEGATPEAGGCPVVHGRTDPTMGDANREWWPNRLNLKILAKNPAVASPLGQDFSYAEAFNSLDFAALKADIAQVLTTSQDWWPADFGNYGPLMIRMAWHGASPTAQSTSATMPHDRHTTWWWLSPTRPSNLAGPPAGSMRRRSPTAVSAWRASYTA